MRLVTKHGGTHHGYFLPAEGASDQAEALFSFESLAAYEAYRERFGVDPEFIEADLIRDRSGCVIRYDRTFMRPLMRWKARGSLQVSRRWRAASPSGSIPRMGLGVPGRSPTRSPRDAVARQLGRR